MNTEKYVAQLSTHLSCANYSKRTIKTYCSLLRKFLSAGWKAETPKQINADQLKRYIATRSSESTMRQVHGMLGHFYRCLHQPKKLKWVPYPKKSKRLPVVIAQEELNSRISSIENLKHKCVCMLLYGCGLRRAELLNLKVADVDSQRMLVFVRHGKGAKDRMVPISEEMLSTLRMYWKSYRPKEFLIEGAQGGRYSPQSVLKVCYKHVGVKPHTLRHCYATHLHENGVDIKTIQELLGHANVKTTEIYTHVSSATLAKVQVPLKLAA